MRPRAQDMEADVKHRTHRWLVFWLALAVRLSAASNAAGQATPPPAAQTASAANDPQAVRFALAHQHTASWCFGYLYVSPTAISYVESMPPKDQGHSFNFQLLQITTLDRWNYAQQNLNALELKFGKATYHFWWMANEQAVQTGRPYQWNPPDAADPQQLIDIIQKWLPPGSRAALNNASAAGPATSSEAAPANSVQAGQNSLVSSAVGALGGTGNGNQLPPGTVGGRIGLGLGNLTLEKSRALGLFATSGAWVMEVEPSGSAGQAGVRVDDVITSLNGAPIRKALDVRAALRHLAPGSTAELHILRQGQAIKITVKLVK
jgi:PDZ domain